MLASGSSSSTGGSFSSSNDFGTSAIHSEFDFFTNYTYRWVDFPRHLAGRLRSSLKSQNSSQTALQCCHRLRFSALFSRFPNRRSPSGLQVLAWSNLVRHPWLTNHLSKLRCLFDQVSTSSFSSFPSFTSFPPFLSFPPFPSFPPSSFPSFPTLRHSRYKYVCLLNNRSFF